MAALLIRQSCLRLESLAATLQPDAGSLLLSVFSGGLSSPGKSNPSAFAHDIAMNDIKPS
jgi:hypothetical protein